MDDTTPLKLIELMLDAGANPNARLKLFPPSIAPWARIAAGTRC